MSVAMAIRLPGSDGIDGADGGHDEQDAGDDGDDDVEVHAPILPRGTLRDTRDRHEPHVDRRPLQPAPRAFYGPAGARRGPAGSRYCSAGSSESPDGASEKVLTIGFSPQAAGSALATSTMKYWATVRSPMSSKANVPVMPS